MEVPRMLKKSDGMNLKMKEIIKLRPPVPDGNLEFRHLKEYVEVNYLDGVEKYAVSADADNSSHTLEHLKHEHELLRTRFMEEVFFYKESKLIGEKVLASVPDWGTRSNVIYKIGTIDYLDEGAGTVSINFVNGEDHDVREHQIIYPFNLVEKPEAITSIRYTEHKNKNNTDTGIILSISCNNNDGSMNINVLKEKYTDKNGKYIPDRVEVLLKQFYFPGTITSINDNGTFNVLFDDGNVKNRVVVENIKGAISIDLNKFSIKLA